MVTRAQGLPISTVVVAVLLLVVLLVVGFLMARQGGVFTKTVSQCEEQGGKCLATASECAEQEGQLLSLECPKGKVCCRF